MLVYLIDITILVILIFSFRVEDYVYMEVAQIVKDDVLFTLALAVRRITKFVTL